MLFPWPGVSVISDSGSELLGYGQNLVLLIGSEMIEMPGVVADKMECLVYHTSRILARSREAVQLYSVKGCRLPG